MTTTTTRRMKVTVLYLDPIQGRRRMFELTRVTPEQEAHYRAIAVDVALGRHRSVALYDFCELDISSGVIERYFPAVILQPTGIANIRIEEDES